MSSRPLNDCKAVSTDDLTQKIKAEARRLGFFACGVARAQRVSPEAEAELRRWLEEGREADMEYMANYTDKRLDPRLLMPGAKSIVCVALNYAPQQTPAQGQYQFAAYALGKDYHDIMKERLRALATAFGFEDALHSQRGEGLYRAFADTGPLLERYWAQQAGLGWTGRNHQLIIPHAGSMFFLGELLLDVELRYDQPMRSRCGRCHRCVDSCPTQAILPSAHSGGGAPDTVFDARRCLSYQLIENRRELSPEAKRAMGDCIYGCDRCQQACPWNHFATPTCDPLLQPSPELLKMTKDDWRHLTVEQYRRLFKGSAVKRVKYEGLMRNIQAAEAEDCRSKKYGKWRGFLENSCNFAFSRLGQVKSADARAYSNNKKLNIMKPTLLLLAAGMGSRYGGLKQLDGLGPNGETIMDYSIYDAIQAGFGKIVFVIRKTFEQDFCDKVLSKYEGHIPAELCFQSLDALPEGFKVPEGREKPWGTNHAVMMAKELIHEPFCVVNCDDFYNRDAFMVMGKFLSNLPEGSKNRYAMVGFRVGNTLSENGTVARGVCSKNAEGHLTTVVERTEIMRVNGEVCYKDEAGNWQPVGGDNTPVSMNMWGFTPDYFDYSDAEFKVFLSDPKNMSNPKAEFFIPLMVNKLINDGTATVQVLDTTSKWFGVTYQADRASVVAKIQSLVDAGVYPKKLF